MIDIDIIKVWMFYLKGETVPYAFTSVKEYKTRFLKERNPKCFDVEKIEMDEFEFSMFLYKNNPSRLSEMPVNTSLTDYINILMTPREYEQLHHRATVMDSEMERIYKNFVNKLNVKDKYILPLNYLCTTVYLKKRETGEIERLSTVNLLFLFMQLFKNTFEVERNDD